MKDSKPYCESFESAAHSETEVEVVLANGILAHSMAWNVHMGADNVMANAEASLLAVGVVYDSGAGRFRFGTGPDGQAVSFFTALTGDGPRSVLAITVSDPNYTRSTTLRDQIRDDLFPKLGL